MARVVGLAVTFYLLATPALAYLTFGDLYFGGEYLKWGDPTFGTGATVHWGFMADGTDGTAIEGVMGTSHIGQLRTSLDNAYGAGQFNAAIERALQTWSRAANVNFIGPDADSGLPINDPAPPCRKFALVHSIQFPTAGFSLSVRWALRHLPMAARWRAMCCSTWLQVSRFLQARKT